MSHDQGRPSLFAGMEDGATPGSDTQRVRILSTLESTRRSQRPARKGPQPAKTAASTQSRAWVVTLGLGVVTLLVSFVLIVQGQRPKAAPKHTEQQAKTPAPSASMALAAVEVASTASAEQDEAAVAGNNLEALPPTSASSSSIPSRDPMAVLASTAPEVPSSAPAANVSKVQPSATAKAKTSKPSKSARNDHDVALIEAVMNRGASSPSKH